MKKVLLLTLLVAITSPLLSQSKMKCVYLEEAVNNPNQAGDISHDEFVLAIDGKQSAFYSRNARLKTEKKDSLLKQGVMPMEILATLQSIPNGKTLEVYKNHPTEGEYTYIDKMVKSYRYVNALPAIKWQIEDGTKQILGHSCRKAVGQLHGRRWTVWFTMAIPVSEGPWLLAGLPGLILEAADGDNLFHFTAIELGIDNSLSVQPDDGKYIKCSRSEFLKMRQQFDENPMGMIEMSTGIKVKRILDKNGKEKSKQDIKRKRNYYENE